MDLENDKILFMYLVYFYLNIFVPRILEKYSPPSPSPLLKPLCTLFPTFIQLSVILYFKTSDIHDTVHRSNCSYLILNLVLLQLNNVDNVRKQLEVQTNDLRQTIEDKLRSAEENRTENMGKMLEKLKDHVSIIKH